MSCHGQSHVAGPRDQRLRSNEISTIDDRRAKHAAGSGDRMPRARPWRTQLVAAPACSVEGLGAARTGAQRRCLATQRDYFLGAAATLGARGLGFFFGTPEAVTERLRLKSARTLVASGSGKFTT